jgi:hypothetical protein
VKFELLSWRGGWKPGRFGHEAGNCRANPLPFRQVHPTVFHAFSAVLIPPKKQQLATAGRLR